MSSNQPFESDDNLPKTNLIINYLPPGLQEDELVSLFLAAGAIDSVRIMKNYDGRTKGYGFVKFHHEWEAKRAIEMFDGMQIRGKKLKVAFSRPGGARDNANLFVTHIPAKWDSETLGQHFSVFGEVVEARILEKDGSSRLCGFVRFNKSENALLALRDRHCWTPAGAHRQLKVTLATKPQRFAGRRRSHHSRSEPSYYSSNSDASFSSYSPDFETPSTPMHQPVPSFGKEIYQQQQYYKSQFNMPRYMNGMKSTNSTSLQNTTESVEKKEATSSEEERSIFVYNIPLLFTSQDVQNLCIKYGSVSSVMVQGDNSGRSLGMAFVCFDNPEESTKAWKGLSRCTILDRQIEVQIL